MLIYFVCICMLMVRLQSHIFFYLSVGVISWFTLVLAIVNIFLMLE